MHVTHHSIGIAILAAGLFLGIGAIAWWAREQLERARDRQARREFAETVTDLPGYFDVEEPVYVEWEPISYWPPAGQAAMHFFGTDLVRYDPAADAAEFMRKQEADTSAFIARMTGI